MKKQLLNLAFVILLLAILTLAYSIPDIIYPDHEPINYSGLTERQHELTLLDCTSFEAHKATMKRIENHGTK